MSYLLRTLLRAGFAASIFPIVSGVAIATSSSVSATEATTALPTPEVVTLPANPQKIALEVAPNELEGQVTSVSQLSDVQPTDWAFQAIQSLVERYGCIAGYPDGTFRGNRAATRYELAAALNACLDQISDRFSTKEDLSTIKALQEEFKTELATLKGRVDGLEARTKTLEAQQFSTTTKLSGQVVFSLMNAFGDRKADGSGDPVGDNTIFTDRVRLIFDTSFSGKDLLKIRLQAGNTPDTFDTTGTRMTRLAFGSPSDNQFSVNQLEYRFPLGNKGTVFVEAIGFLDLFVPTLNALDGDFNTVLSSFGLRSPIYFQSGLSGVGFNYDVTKRINIGGGYLAGAPIANGAPSGLFDGPYGAMIQATFRPVDKFSFALTYVRAYDDGSGNAPPGAFFGSENATFPFGTVPTAMNSYGFQTQYRFSPRFIASAWAALTQAEAKSGPNKGANADVLNWALTLAFPDLGKQGSLGGFVFGQPSKVINNDIVALEDRDTSFHIEAFYRYQINDNIGITPGIIVITDPEHNSSNDTTILGIVRTTFSF